MQHPHMQASPSGQADSMTEDLFVMTAAGGLVRHKLTHMHTGGPTEAGLANGDRWVSILPSRGRNDRKKRSGDKNVIAEQKKENLVQDITCSRGQDLKELCNAKA